MTAYDLWKFHDDREDFDNNHCPHGESWDDPCDECEAENESFCHADSCAISQPRKAFFGAAKQRGFFMFFLLTA